MVKTNQPGLGDGVDLPRLLYLGDVPVESTYHGSALLYRLLHDYSKDRLAVVEAGSSASKLERRLEGVEYHAALTPLERFGRTRFHTIHQAATLKFASVRTTKWSGLARRFGVQAILTVAHGSSWISAATLAKMLGVPLHLICHDEWARAGILQNWKDRVLGEQYRAAASRLCVSPFMAEEYERRYGARGDVLYPSRAADAPRYEAPPERLAKHSGDLTVAFAGTINSRGMVTALRTLAECLANHRGRLQLYGPLTPEQAKTDGLDSYNIENHGLLPSRILMEQLRAEADVLYVPMSFAEEDRINMQMSFPSKLADYTAVGLPLLIQGPEYCSAARWALDNAGAAELVTAADGSGLRMTIARLAADQAHRVSLGTAALEVGARYFGFEVARDTLFNALLNCSATGHTVRAPAI